MCTLAQLVAKNERPPKSRVESQQPERELTAEGWSNNTWPLSEFATVNFTTYNGINMQVDLPDKTVRDVEAMLAKRGENGNVSEFIDRTLQRALFFETVRDIKRQNADAEPKQLDRLINEAVAAARADRSRTNRDANGA
jgi:Arc/MetJ-type ribon-helix-helix transcriptional regulator